MKRKFLFIVFLLNIFYLNAQRPIKQNSSEIFESIKKLNFFGTVLYIAAHPDDENTRLISYFSNDVKARTGYLSITRGDGGQNLIGPELQELLGVIRTQELLAARRVDGGEQFFTRAKDFGYSKHPDETLKLWNKDEVLKDVITVIRKFKPDVIINRFDHRTPGTTHGQHTSSAMLSVEAFDLVGDPSFKSHNLFKPWQPKRLFFNTSWWFYGSQKRFADADKSKMLSFDTGLYNPISGMSNSEIASLSRSQHQSQGFGSTGSRGSELEYVEFIKGEFSKSNNIFDGINTTWSRVEGGKVIGEILTRVEEKFDFKNPSASVPELLKAYQLIEKLEDEHWKELKLEQIRNIIAGCAGLYMEAVAQESSSYHKGEVSIKVEIIKRSEVNIKLNSISVTPIQITESPNIDLQDNKRENFTLKGKISQNVDFTDPYWLNEEQSIGMYKVRDPKLIGKPETPRNLKVNFILDFDGFTIPFNKDVVYKFNDPVKGEVYEPFEILPVATAKILNEVNIFANNDFKEIPITITSLKDELIGSVSLCYPNDWKVTPERIDFRIDQKGEEKTVLFKLTPPDHQSEGKISPIVSINEKSFTKKLVEISYDHIPKQSVLIPSEAKIVRLDIKTKGNLIGYIQGAGDNIPSSLRQIGYNVIELNENDINAENLQNFDAVILGIRAYNVNERTKYYQKELHTYTENGGTLIVQYNTNFRLKVDQVSPFDLKLSRDRVVEENSVVTILNPNHEVMAYPNKITDKDFEGWIQERGLYFPNEWSEEFIPLLSMNDNGESPKKGSLLIANYGKGHFIYTGLSFFRELPAGVPGAYKLFANMISVGENSDQNQLKN